MKSKEPWPSLGIDHYQTIHDGPWGYLIVDDDGVVSFDESTHPSDAEILEQWGHRFKGAKIRSPETL